MLQQNAILIPTHAGAATVLTRGNYRMDFTIDREAGKRSTPARHPIDCEALLAFTSGSYELFWQPVSSWGAWHLLVCIYIDSKNKTGQPLSCLGKIILSNDNVEISCT